MKSLFFGLLVFSSLSTFAQASNDETSCQLEAAEQILNSKKVQEKIIQLLAESNFLAVAQIQDSAFTLASQVCEQ